MSAFRAPAAILDELGITEPTEIDIEAIAQYCGATIVFDRLDGSAARILGRVSPRGFVTTIPLLTASKAYHDLCAFVD